MLDLVQLRKNLSENVNWQFQFVMQYLFFRFDLFLQF